MTVLHNHGALFVTKLMGGVGIKMGTVEVTAPLHHVRYIIPPARIRSHGHISPRARGAHFWKQRWWKQRPQNKMRR